MLISFLGAFGFIVSLYAFHIENSLDVPYCDINEYISCSKALQSDYSHLLSTFHVIPHESLLDLSNSSFGLLLFPMFMLYPIFGNQYAALYHYLSILMLVRNYFLQLYHTPLDYLRVASRNSSFYPA